MQNYKTKKVYILNKEGKPLMPCRIIKARHLLKNKQAKIVKYEPFTIQLLFECEDKVQDVSLNIDSGSKEIGLCAKTDKKELYSAEAKIRGSEIVELISKRKQLRQSRRSRKTRYRECRFLNRKREERWLPPSIRSKIDAHKKLISDVYKILPIKKLIVEVASFDIQKIKNPTIQGKEYRQGEQLGWENVKSYIKFRDSYKCQALKTCKNKGLEVHHLESRMTGGNAPNNLTTLCEKHHQEVTDGKRELKIKRGESFKDASFMNIMRLKLVEELKKLYSNVSETYGYITKSVREEHKLEKSHRNDALCINGNLLVERSNEWYQIKQVRKKKRNLHEVDPRKEGKRRNYNVKQIKRKEGLWCLRDKVKLNNEIGFISGFTNKKVFVRDVKNYSLQTSLAHKQINPSKLKLMSRNNNWIHNVEN